MVDEGGWFHCGRCGHLFRGVVGQACPRCGGHPVVEEKEIAFLETASQFRSESVAGPPVPDAEKRSGSKKRRKKKPGGLLWFVIGWMVFLALLAGLANVLRKNSRSSEAGQGSVTEAAEDQRIINEAYEDCTLEVREFLKVTTPEQRAQAVHDPTGTLRKMVRSGGIALRVDEDEAWAWERFTPLMIAGERAFEGVIRFKDGRRAEFVFLPDGEGGWGIDWPHLVRYSEHPWPLFVSGSGPASGEFRLLARRRAGPSGQIGDVTSIVFFAPRPWEPRELGARSPQIEIARGSRMARMLEEAFENREEGRGVFGSRLAEEDPVSMIRVRVKLRRSEAEEGGDPGIEVEELVACHWMSVDDPGVEAGDE